jgi:hypothetical protein
MREKQTGENNGFFGKTHSCIIRESQSTRVSGDKGYFSKTRL